MEINGNLKGKKIAVGLSGGVDSSVAALLLARAGYDVFALFMQNWHDVTGTLHGECEWEEDRKVAGMVARKIGIPFEFIDLSDTYRYRVVDYMFSEYSKGRTPNPDVLCNSEIKFDAFLKAARDLGADYVATGHYCRKDVTAGPDGKPVYRILAGADGNKDQSYFLCQLTQEQLSAALFPIGDIVKPEVRRLAREAGLPSAEKKDSQGICFVGKVDLPVFLQQKLASREGNVVEIFRDFYDNIRAEYPGYTAATSEPDATDITALGPSEVRALARAYHYRESDGRKIGTHIGAQYYRGAPRTDIYPRHIHCHQYHLRGGGARASRPYAEGIEDQCRRGSLDPPGPPDGSRGGAPLLSPRPLPPASAAGCLALPG